MYGGAICLGYVMAKPWTEGVETSSAAHWLAAESFGMFVSSKWGFVFSLMFISLFLTEAISNTAVVALMLPLALGLGADFDLDPRLVTLALTIPCGLAFQLPMGTPATAIAFSSGFVELKDTLLGGLILKIFAFILLTISITFYWPLIGF
jgi:sodium-dependent dicarboxylate transporter 2/3/5